MPMFDETHVKVDGAIILWDAMTRPDANESGTKHSFKVALPPNSPDGPLLDQIANARLYDSDFKGTLPANGTMPFGVLGPNEYGGQFNGWRVFTAGTYRGFPDCYIDNVVSEPMHISPLIYPGQVVDLLVHCYANNGKVKGVACGLDGFSVRASANAPRQNFGGVSIDTSGAFGGAPAQQPGQYTAPNQAAPAQQPGQYTAPNQAAPAQQPGQYTAPNQAAPAQQPGQYTAPNQAAPAQQPGQYTAPNQAAPAQQPGQYTAPNQAAPAQQPGQYTAPNQAAPAQQPGQYTAPNQAAPAQQPTQAHNYLPQQ